MPIDRRGFLRLLGVGTGTAVLEGCDWFGSTGPTPQRRLAVSNGATIGYDISGSTAATDLRGEVFRGSRVFPDEPSAYGHELYVQDFESLRRSLGVETVNLFGYSHMGYFAVAYALAHPNRVRSLVLVEPMLFNDPAELLSAAERAESGDGVGALATGFAQFMGPQANAARGRATAERVRRNYQSDTALAGQLRVRAEHPISNAHLASLRTPVLVVGGTASYVRANAERTAKSIPSASLHWIPRADHSTVLVSSERVAKDFFVSYSETTVVVSCPVAHDQGCGCPV